MSKNWRQIQLENFTDWVKLADFLELDEEQRLEIFKRPTFPLMLPVRLARKIKKKSLYDPLLKQFLPTIAEKNHSEGFLKDPVEDTKFRKTSRLLQKYQGRALLIATGACAMNCRFCFRQNFDYPILKEDFSEEVKYLEKDSSIKEVILSGGDPLALSNASLQKLISQLQNIPHLKRLRFHTRFPIGIPERIDDEFLQILSESSLSIWFLIHCNHPRELDEDIFFFLGKIQSLGIPVLSQSTLLRGVNDDVTVLKELYETLVDHHVVPYYLHQLDKVIGASHFFVTEEEGKNLMAELSEQVSGYAVPKYVKEIPGYSGKSIII